MNEIQYREAQRAYERYEKLASMVHKVDNYYMYLEVTVDGENVSREIPMKEISKLIAEHYREKRDEALKKFQEI